ncbi:glycosytransferase [Acidovorax sp. Root275]|nr:glycosytransferase [Acidovorax sp. Root275]
MSSRSPLRVMWLLNHTSARKFEISMLKRIGVEQIFLPKSYPDDPRFRSASVDYSEDDLLEIPKDDLEILNKTDWYAGGDENSWRLANKYFDVVFIIFYSLDIFQSVSKHFYGAVVWRVFGTQQPMTYGKIIAYYGGERVLKRLGKRFYFGEAYSHLADQEPSHLRDRRCYLPLGMLDIGFENAWKGECKKILFVCPDIAFNDYYKKTYESFCKDFGDFPYMVSGAQPVAIADPHVLGFVSGPEHHRNMVQARVMFYQSRESHHIHYHPFEAVRIGMPLVFMSGGMLDRLGGDKLPGRCSTIREARAKIERILGDDWKFIEEICSTQRVLLSAMDPQNMVQLWREGFQRIAADLEASREKMQSRPIAISRKRVAVILPVGYRGGSLRGALLLAKALYLGSRQAGEPVDVVFLHLDESATYSDADFDELPEGVLRRPYSWKTLTASQALRAMRYAGFSKWEPAANQYIVPNDGIQQLQDCDLWLVVSDRLSCPLLPLKSSVLMVFDYLQRYEPVISKGTDHAFLMAARAADRVLVTTDFTWRDAIQYAGLEPGKVRKVPMLAPEFPVMKVEQVASPRPSEDYFLWTTNAAAHKNHVNAARALEIYYGELGGHLNCRVTGVNTQGLRSGEGSHIQAMAEVFDRSEILDKRVRWCGELPDLAYRELLRGALFLWHAGRIDNGTFSVVEAACLGVPSLSSDYPAMREMDAQFSLGLSWMDPASPRDMAMQLKQMEHEAMARRARLPTIQQLSVQSVEALAPFYWKEVRACL